MVIDPFVKTWKMMKSVMIITSQPQDLHYVIKLLAIMGTDSTQREIALSVSADALGVLIMKRVAHLDFFSILLLNNVTGLEISMDVNKSPSKSFLIFLMCKTHQNSICHMFIALLLHEQNTINSR